MKLFLYCKYESQDTLKIYHDFTIFMGDHLDKRGNHKFKMNYVLLTLNDNYHDGDILMLSTTMESIEELEKINDVYRKILFLVFNQGRRKK